MLSNSKESRSYGSSSSRWGDSSSRGDGLEVESMSRKELGSETGRVETGNM